MIKILEYVRNNLSTDSAVTALVGNKIYPNVVPDMDVGRGQIMFPHIVMNRLAIDPTYTKTKGCNQDLAEVEVVVWAKDYKEGTTAIQAVRDSLEFSTGNVGVTVSKCRLVGALEGFDDGNYWQKLVFNFK